MKFYDNIPDMECLAGDTLPTFNISVDADSISGCSMQVIVARSNNPNTAVLCKDCTSTDGGFEVQLTSDDTSGLISDMYDIHFRLIDADGKSYRKLYGKLWVTAAAEGQ